MISLDDLQEWASAAGCRLSGGAPDLLEVLRSELARDCEAGRFGEGLQRRVLTRFRYLDGADVAPVRSLLVVAVPRPAHLISVTMPSGLERTLRLPPVYLAVRETARGVASALLAGPLSGASGVALAGVPLKALAVRLGLGVYGRNNVCYVPGFGSYHQLVAVVTDSPVRGLKEQLGHVCAASECDSCGACAERCPTTAITGDRFPIDAERCLGHLNERPDPWPAWLPPEAHNCLLGCLACQEHCPQNDGLLRCEPTGVRLDADETRAMLAHAAGGPEFMPISTKAANGPNGLAGATARQSAVSKLGALGLDRHDAVLSRNLRALLALQPPPGLPAASC